MFSSSAATHWPIKATPFPRTRATSSPEPPCMVTPATTVLATTSTTGNVGKGEPTWAYGKTKGQQTLK